MIKHRTPYKTEKSSIRTLANIILLFFIVSCSSPRNVVIACQERHIEIYVDGQYLGRDMVDYIIPKGQKYAEISCRNNGIEVYYRKVYVEDLKTGNIIEIQIPRNLKYSNNRHY